MSCPVSSLSLRGETYDHPITMVTSHYIQCGPGVFLPPAVTRGHSWQCVHTVKYTKYTCRCTQKHIDRKTVLMKLTRVANTNRTIQGSSTYMPVRWHPDTNKKQPLLWYCYGYPKYFNRNKNTQTLQESNSNKILLNIGIPTDCFVQHCPVVVSVF